MVKITKIRAEKYKQVSSILRNSLFSFKGHLVMLYQLQTLYRIKSEIWTKLITAILKAVLTTLLAMYIRAIQSPPAGNITEKFSQN
jgi:hypothetical protein